MSLTPQALEHVHAILAQADAKLDQLRHIEPYLIDLSLRENPVGSNLGQTLADKLAILPKLREFGFRNISEESLAPFLLVEAPRLLFPFARQVVAEAVQNLGFPPLLLDPIDFGAAYMAQLEAQQQAAGQAGGDGEPPVGHA